MNVGFIGVGAFAARQHLPNLARDERYRLHTLCDLNPDLLAQRTAQFNPVRSTTDADALLRDPDVQVVFIGTRSRQHADLIRAAAAQGKHVFVEKPMTMTHDETRAVVEAVTQANVTLGVGFNRRFAPATVEAKRRFDALRQGPANIIYRIVDDHAVRPAYIFDMNDGGGHLLQEACHVFDVLAWLIDQEPVEVYAVGPLETDNIVVLRFADDSIATVVCGGKGGLFYPKECMEVFCNRSTLVVDQFFELRADGPAGAAVVRFGLDPKSEITLSGATMSDFYQASLAQRPDHDVTDTTEANALHQLKVNKGHTEMIRAFSDALAGGQPFAPGVLDGARATTVALCAYDAIRTRRPVSVPAPAELH